MRDSKIGHEEVEEKSSWTIEKGCWNRILRHAVASYPKEACGILLSHSENQGHVEEVYSTKNVSLEDQASRYLVDPLEFLEVDKWAEEKGLDICGFYHSHPDHPAAPSEYDRKTAWEAYLYLILSIKGGKFEEARAWIYDPDAGHFKGVPFKPYQDKGHHDDSSPPP